MFPGTKTYAGLLLIIMILTPYYAAGQLDIWVHLKYLQLNFNETDTDSLDIASANKERSDRLIRAAIGTGDREILLQAFGDLFESTRTVYNIYDRDFRGRRGDLPPVLPEELKIIDYMGDSAGENMNRSILIKKEAEKSENIERLTALYYVAYDLEMLALLNKGRALRMIRDYPVIYRYVWDEDMTRMDGLHEGIIREVIEEEETGVPEKQEPGLKEREGVSYVIQIAAHTNELSYSHLRAIYSGDFEIGMIYEENWYRYYLGPWNTFEEASKVMNSVNLSNSFISAYHNGRRIGVSEARRRQAQGQR